MKRDQARDFLEQNLAELLQARQHVEIIPRAADLREMKDVRNIIAHDYAGTKAAEIFAYCREQKPMLDAICDRVTEYARHIMSGN